MTKARWRTILERNLSQRKPQLWANLPRSLMQHAFRALGPLLDPSWLDTPRVVPLADGVLRMEVVPRDAIGMAIFLYGIYEVPVTHFLNSFLRGGDVFVDVGANSGYHTLVAARRVGPAGEVHAFEPVAALRDRLSRNVAMNGISNCTIHPEAVWERGGQVQFVERYDPANSGLSAVVRGDEAKDETRLVASTTLDEVATSLGTRIRLIKIDVEGGEAEVFRGGERTLGADEAPTLVFEAHDIKKVAPLLQEQGYAVRHLAFSPRRGLFFPELGESFDNPFAEYEAPNFVATKKDAVVS